MRCTLPAVVVSACLVFSAVSFAGEATVPGDVGSPYPTATNLAVEWKIQGDDNLNGVVTVRYRQVGTNGELGTGTASRTRPSPSPFPWREAMPLRRVPAGQSKGTRPVFQWENKHSGSIFDLKPDTEYQIELRLADPDGGSAVRTVRARTRAVPRPMPGGPVKKAEPGTIKDALAAARPGDVLLLGAGQYGELTVPCDGEPGRPMVLRGSPQAGGALKAAGGEAAGGPASPVCSRVNLRGRKHIIVEGLTVNGPIDLIGASDCAVRRCEVTVKGAGFGIGAPRKPGATNCYIADNVVAGSTPWTNEAMGASGKNEGEGIEITGPGNVICYNRVRGFRDCISTMEDTLAGEQVCIDIYNNDIYVGADDGIEADFCMGNCRILRNRMTNCFVGLSSQPGLGGPTYFIRNVMYNLTYVPFKLHRYSQGDVCLHNTVVKPGDGMACFAAQTWDFAFFRNNLCIGGPPGGLRWGGYGGGSGQAVEMPAAGEHCSFDCDALGTHGTPFRGRIGPQRFAGIEELRKGPHETHAVQADMAIFKDVAFPDKPLTQFAPPDLRPRDGSAVVDKGERLPNVNDDFRGQGPDIGAYEAGQDLPHYGPRPEGVDEATPGGRQQ